MVLHEANRVFWLLFKIELPTNQSKEHGLSDLCPHRGCGHIGLRDRDSIFPKWGRVASANCTDCLCTRNKVEWFKDRQTEYSHHDTSS